MQSIAVFQKVFKWPTKYNFGPILFLEQCVDILNKILKYTIETLKYSDISYNYIIGEDGNVYEGRGTYKAGFHFDSILKLLLAAECI